MSAGIKSVDGKCVDEDPKKVSEDANDGQKS
jgi:hypothetical protein